MTCYYLSFCAGYRRWQFLLPWARASPGVESSNPPLCKVSGLVCFPKYQIIPLKIMTRLCMTGEVETEVHFLLKCDKNNKIREECYKDFNLIIPNFRDY